jgi:general secretion pathway protein N
MKYGLLGLLFIIALIITLALTAPLGFVLRHAGTERLDLEWDSASGSLLSGSISGLRIAGEPLGDAELNLEPAGLLRGRLQYRVSLDGPSGRGNGQLAFAGSTLEARDLRVEVNLSSLRDAPVWLRQSTGSLRLRADLIRFEDRRCTNASGTSWSDALLQQVNLPGAGWPELTGSLRCDDGALLIPLSGQSADAIMLNADTWLNLTGNTRFEARVTGNLRDDYRLALAYAGFLPDGNGLLFRMPESTGNLNR